MSPKPAPPEKIRSMRLPVEIGIYEFEGESRLANPDHKPGLWERLLIRVFGP